MHASAKYLIHATVRTNGVVERSDVVGAIFGQTEGLLGDQLDLRDLQESSKVGRIDVSIESEGGRSIGAITIGSGLDRVETAVLAAALETIDRVGPCRAECTVTEIEDARAAKRRALVDRATDLLGDLEETTATTEQLVEEVRRKARVEEITEYAGYPAGPHVDSSDAIIVVEGRADVRRLLKYGIKNAVAVEGTDIPTEIAELTFERNTTAFLDGDRGGDLILRELQQVGEVDYVAFAPTDQSVEDLDRAAILSALRRKVPLEQVSEQQTPRQVFGPTDVEALSDTAAESETSKQPPEEDTSSEESPSSSTTDAPDEVTTEGDASTEVATESDASTEASNQRVQSDGVGVETTRTQETAVDGSEESSPTLQSSENGDAEQAVARSDAGDEETATIGEPNSSKSERDDAGQQHAPNTLTGHVDAIITQRTGTTRFLDDEFAVLDEMEAENTFEAILESDQIPTAVILDGTLTQRILDGAAQRGVGQIVARETGEFVKQPTDVRIRTASDLEVEA